MMPRTLLGLSLAAVLSLAGAVTVGGVSDSSGAPDTSKIISLVGRFNMAHTCPIAADLAVTNAHVLDPNPFNPGSPLLPYRGQNGAQSGVLDPVSVSWLADVGFQRPHGGSFSSWYEVASVGPAEGEQIWWIGYDWSKESRAMQRRVFTAKVVRTLAGTIVIREPSPPGSSGSCILNAAGQVVGIVAWSVRLDNEHNVAFGVGLWDGWLELPKKVDTP